MQVTQVLFDKRAQENVLKAMPKVRVRTTAQGLEVRPTDRIGGQNLLPKGEWLRELTRKATGAVTLVSATVPNAAHAALRVQKGTCYYMHEGKHGWYVCNNEAKDALGQLKIGVESEEAEAEAKKRGRPAATPVDAAKVEALLTSDDAAQAPVQEAVAEAEVQHTQDVQAPEAEQVPVEEPAQEVHAEVVQTVGDEGAAQEVQQAA